MLNLSKKQQEIKSSIETFAVLLDVDPSWATAIAMTESSLGEHQQSPTGCLGVFQMSSIAMKDLLQNMSGDDDLIDIVCGVAFLRLLMKRWKTIENATLHFCDPADRHFYLDRVKKFMRELET
jgi:membrane-bound lytic murein transglycosylase MltF